MADKRLKLFALLFLFFCIPLLPAQNSDNVAFVMKSIKGTSPPRQPAPLQHTAKSELAFFGSFLLTSYQKFISSQDKPVCIFSTSCSNFGVLAVGKKGFILGTFLTADRLTRCNSEALHYYAIDPANQRRTDPVIDLKLK